MVRVDDIQCQGRTQWYLPMQQPLLQEDIQIICFRTGYDPAEFHFCCMYTVSQKTGPVRLI